MEKKYIERLEQVIRVLEELPREKKFDITTFMVCGTTACACGWAGADPWFRRRGFKTEKYETLYEYDVFYKHMNGMNAVREFFGLDLTQSHHLFIQSLNNLNKDCSKRGTIRRLKAFIKETTKETIHV